MRMRGKKPIFSYKDTWNLDNTLSPIICEGFKKFKEVIVERHENGKCLGVPMWAYEELGIDCLDCTKEDEDRAFEYYAGAIDQVIFAFDINNEPNLKDYDIGFEMKILDRKEDGSSEIDVEVKNQDERYRYDQDCEEWLTKCEEGRKIMTEKWDSWWW